MKIVIAGATGFIGKALTGKLSGAGHEVFVLTRSVRQVVRETGGRTLIPWDGRTAGEWCGFLDGADAVINLAGENIAAKPWTAKQKHRILSSRTDATSVIVQAIKSSARKPRVLVNASAAGYYGNIPEGEVTEAHPRGNGFLAKTCEYWEESALRAEHSGVRVVVARFGLVLEKDGGMLQRMLAPFRFFAGGPLGSGKQWLSWIHREDLVEALIFLLGQGAVSGPVNMTAPMPQRMEEFCKALGKVLKRLSWIRMPGFILKLFLGEMSEMVLDGAKVMPVKLLGAGFRFRYPSLEQALTDILKK